MLDTLPLPSQPIRAASSDRRCNGLATSSNHRVSTWSRPVRGNPCRSSVPQFVKQVAIAIGAGRNDDLAAAIGCRLRRSQKVVLILLKRELVSPERCKAVLAGLPRAFRQSHDMRRGYRALRVVEHFDDS